MIQRRLDGSVDFYRNWESYKEGFGEAEGEYWLGKTNKNYIEDPLEIVKVISSIASDRVDAEIYCIYLSHVDLFYIYGD